MTVGMSGFADDHSAVFIIICALLFLQSAAGRKMLVKCFFSPPFYATAIFPCWWCGSEEDIPGEES